MRDKYAFYGGLSCCSLDESKNNTNATLQIQERYRRDVAALAIFTDHYPRYFPTTYQREHFGVKEVFSFRGYKVMVQNEEELVRSANPFALVILAVRTAILKGQMDDESLWAVKFNLVRLLYERNYSKRKIEELFTFINQYVRFSSKEKSLNFAKHIELTFQPKHNIGMGIIEQAIVVAKEEGIEEGIEQEKKGVILNAQQVGLAIDLIARLVDLSEEKVLEILKDAHRI